MTEKHLVTDENGVVKTASNFNEVEFFYLLYNLAKVANLPYQQFTETFRSIIRDKYDIKLLREDLTVFLARYGFSLVSLTLRSGGEVYITVSKDNSNYSSILVL